MWHNNSDCYWNIDHSMVTSVSGLYYADTSYSAGIFLSYRKMNLLNYLFKEFIKPIQSKIITYNI